MEANRRLKNQVITLQTLAQEKKNIMKKMKRKGKAHVFCNSTFTMFIQLKGKTYFEKYSLLLVHVVVQLEQLVQNKSKDEREESEVEEETGVDSEDEAMEEESDTDDPIFEVEAAEEEIETDEEEIEESSG